jgi:hypothetical protein
MIDQGTQGSRAGQPTDSVDVSAFKQRQGLLRAPNVNVYCEGISRVLVVGSAVRAVEVRWNDRLWVSMFEIVLSPVVNNRSSLFTVTCRVRQTNRSDGMSVDVDGDNVDDRYQVYRLAPKRTQLALSRLLVTDLLSGAVSSGSYKFKYGGGGGV